MVLVLGDFHLKDQLSYADSIEDKREGEKKEILDFIVEQAKDCDTIVLLGDLLNSRTNSPKVIKDLTNFLEKFDGKDIYIISGNHEAFSDGRTALDFLKEIKNKKWNIITNNTKKYQIGHISAVFCPYFTKAELEVETNEDAIKSIFKKLEPADILFHHHTMAFGGKIAGLPLDANQLPEPVFPLEALEQNYKVIFGGHIHKPYTKFKNAIVAGSIFNNEVGETQKYIWKIDETAGDNLFASIQQIKLPGRPILKVENPTIEDLEKLDSYNILKVVMTEEKTENQLSELRKSLKKFDAYMLIENISKKRKKMHYDAGESILEFDISQLLEVYGKEKGVDLKVLKHGFDLIKE